MGLRIFEKDPESAPKPRRFADDLVGRLRSGYKVGTRPYSLEEWRVTSGDPEVLDRIAELYGSKNGAAPQTWETNGEDSLEVYTEAPKVRILLDGPRAITQEMALWGMAGAIRRCDGVEQKGVDQSDPAAGTDCACPVAFADRKEAAKRGTGCKPSITLFFRLADEPELGRFKFTSGSWSFVKDIMEPEKKLAEINGPAVAELGLEVVEYGEGRDKKRFVKPSLAIIGPTAPHDEPPY